MAVYKLNNQIQNYAWGSQTAMTEKLGYLNPENKPMAELWMGAHPKSPSVIQAPSKIQSPSVIQAPSKIQSPSVIETSPSVPLNEMISRDPEAVLGSRTSSAFSGRLPFLFKVLAAGSPLSIQAHPNLAQAAAGFARENAAGIALDAFNRNYKDDNHKPEIICALTEYHAMRGFRPAGVIAANFRKIMISELEPAVSALEAAAASPGAASLAGQSASEENEASAGTIQSVSSAVFTALKNFFTELMQLADKPKVELISAAVGKAENGQLPEARWIKRFSELYPGDIGIVSPLYLNVVTLKPGQAMYLPAGELHAYLEGLGMELMANSDNVLRGGLTPKHVDVPELLSTLVFEPCRPEILSPVSISEYESAYITAAPEFYLSKIELPGRSSSDGGCRDDRNYRDGSFYRLPEKYGPELPSIFICLEGSVTITDDSVTAAEGAVEGEGGAAVKLERGDTAFATYSSIITIEGSGTLYRASVPSKA